MPGRGLTPQCASVCTRCCGRLRYHVLAQVVTSSRVPLAVDAVGSSAAGSSNNGSSNNGSTIGSVAVSSSGGEEVETLQGGSITLARYAGA